MQSDDPVIEQDGANSLLLQAGESVAELRSRFYRSVAETLTLLHTAPGYDRDRALGEVVRLLAETMDLPLVWIGRRAPDCSQLDVLAAAGPASDYAKALQLSNRGDEPGGNGPMGLALRLHRAQAVRVDSPVFAPWRDAAREHGFGSCIAAAADLRDGGQIALAVYSRAASIEFGEDLLDWAQRLAEELARFWEHQALVERNTRMSRYRDAQRTIQRALLDQPDPHAVFRTLAQSLVDIAGAEAVDVLTVEPAGGLRRVALVGPIAAALERLSPPSPERGVHDLPTPMLAVQRCEPQVRIRPRERQDMSPLWQLDPLRQLGALGCWPILADGGGHAARGASGVFALFIREEDAFDEEMCRLLDEIADAAALALRQHERRRALIEEQQRQTYLALHDALTGLPNRRALDMHLECAIARAERSGRLVAVGMLDLDDLKPINDRYGHAVGDRLLVEVAQRLRGALRADDYVARLGGDEFVLVCEGLHGEADLEPLLDAVWRALREPLAIDGSAFELAASLGIALFPEHGKGSGEQLLRRADQAMYQVKLRKRGRDRWWSMPLLPAEAGDPLFAAGHDGRGQAPYGESATQVLSGWTPQVAPRVAPLVAAFIAELRGHDGISRLFDVLPPEDLAVMVRRFTRHLELLLQPDLDAEAHRELAGRAGRFHAAAGLEEVWLLECVERLRDLIAAELGEPAEHDRRPLSIVLQRLGMERQWQLESMREMQRGRVALLARLNALAWSADGYLELVQGVVDALASHEEITSCAVGRPDETGQLTYEAVGGQAFADYLRALSLGQAAPIRVDADSREGAGPSGRAWRSGTIQRCQHYGSDPTMISWRDQALALGIVSSVALPLCPQPPTPSAVLTIYSAYAGGLQSEDQQAFVDQLKTLLDLALARLAPPRPGAALLPFIVRERWRGLVATDALEVHYQPVVRLADGRVTELEALARLRDRNGELLMPGRFLPALGDDDLVSLFRHVLQQAAVQRAVLADAGLPLDMSVNAPAAALEDARYAGAAAAVLEHGQCPAAALLFEILESPMGTEHAAPQAMAGMRALKALGVRLVEDDLGAGYSSLIRLRQWPFDRVKIDQAIVMQVVDEPLRTLRFIRQLIRLGHDLDLEVVVEGLETPGLIEAALLLGADMGQGYALARPMPGVALPAWLAGFRSGWSATRPVTALGALAGTLLWEEQLQALPHDAGYWRRHAEASCAPGSYLLHAPEEAALRDAHDAMHAATAHGPNDPQFRRLRETFLALLTARVQHEELRRG